MTPNPSAKPKPKPKQMETGSSLEMDCGLFEKTETLETLNEFAGLVISKVAESLNNNGKRLQGQKNTQKRTRVPGQVLQLSEEDIEINYRQPLGSGGFCKVYPVTLTPAATIAIAAANFNAGAFGASSVQQHQQHHHHHYQILALKRLRVDVLQNKNLCKIAAADLMQEAELLTDLAHENIIDLYGVRKANSSNNNSSSSSKQDDTAVQQKEKISNHNGDIAEEENSTTTTSTSTSTSSTKSMITAMDPASFFLVMDVLSDTLESRCETWQKKRSAFKQFTPKDSVMSRLQEIVLGIVKGMEYLHSKRIIFRDLKPDNVGFDSENCVKIFDFGLAVKLKVKQDGGKCREFGAGTVRYMAPEVAAPLGNSNNSQQNSNCSYYTLSADVYSFAILLWQIVTSRIPFEADISSFSGPAHLPKNLRPPLKYVESQELQSLLESTWSLTPDERPTFATIGTKLQTILDAANSSTKNGKEKSKRSNRMMMRSAFHR